MNNFVKTIYPSLIWTGIIFILLSLDGSKTGKISFVKTIPHFDKIIHWGLFMVWALLWGYYWESKKKSTSLVMAATLVLTGFGYGMLMEYYQLYFTNRSFSWSDGLADGLGALMGAWLAIKKPLWK